MLPPGIFLWESGQEGLCESATTVAIERSSPLWEADMARCGKWDRFEAGLGMGRFLKAEVLTETTTVIVGKCRSTMEVARTLSENDLLGTWGAVVALEQDGGRGQMRRHWISPPGNLFVSFILPSAPARGAWTEKYNGLLSLLCGYLIGNVLNECGAAIKIKWPNDLLQSNRKIGGMLIEERSGVDILGLGLNLVESPDDALMREDCSVSAGLLRTNPPLQGVLSLWEALVSRGKTLYEILLGELQPSQFVSALSGHLAWMEEGILVSEREGSSYQAEIIGISPEGGLVIRHAEGEEVLFSGSIKPR